MWLEISSITVIVITTLNFCKLVILYLFIISWHGENRTHINHYVI